jgi:acyl carrier protein
MTSGPAGEVMSQGGKPAVVRDDVVSMIASLGDRTVDEVGDRIDSMQLAWLLHQVEQRYGVEIELDDGQYARMTTVDGAVEVLGEAIAAVPR